jgi:hypothetical protein
MRGATADLAPPPPKCPAAKGVAGDNLLCVDFSKVAQLSDPALAGWDFTASMSNCPGWQIANNMLSVKMFSTFMGECGFTLPAIDLKQADKQKYQGLTISVVQRVSVSDPDQKAQLYLGAADANTRLVIQTNGKNQRQQTMINITKADLPAAVNSVYQYLFKITSSVPVGGTVQGWQIESIAVNGVQ